MMTAVLHAETVTEPGQRSMTREIETEIGNVTDKETKIVVVTTVVATSPVGSILQKSYICCNHFKSKCSFLNNLMSYCLSHFLFRSRLHQAAESVVVLLMTMVLRVAAARQTETAIIGGIVKDQTAGHGSRRNMMRGEQVRGQGSTRAKRRKLKGGVPEVRRVVLVVPPGAQVLSSGRKSKEKGK
jgi:hypothetical protein